MRVYKIDNQYIDLDHILMVSELEFWDSYDETDYDAWFYVTLAFHEKQKQLGFKIPERDIDNPPDMELERRTFKKEYDDFLRAWQNKPSVVIPDPLPPIQIRTGKPGK